MSKVYSDYVAKAQLLSAKMKKNVAQLKNKGIDEQFISKLESDNGLAATYNEEIDKLKADIKTKTRQANIKLNEVKRQVKEAKKIIKSDFDKKSWPEFGISDKK
ncbi:MAG: hypothetical protein LLG13_10670 [Bacteroidales bacterium]|nr:hypothetical protein [Bacteroidales bacterium]